MFTFSRATPSTQLDIDASYPSPGTVRVAVLGEIDLSSSDMLRVRLLNILSVSHPRRIEVDLAGVTFLDCGGLTVLVILSRTAIRTGCRLRITNPRPLVRRVLDLTGLLDVLTAGFDLAALPATAAESTGIPAVTHRSVAEGSRGQVTLGYRDGAMAGVD